MAVPLIDPSFRQPLPRANVVGVVSFLGGLCGFGFLLGYPGVVRGFRDASAAAGLEGFRSLALRCKLVEKSAREVVHLAPLIDRK